MRFWSLKTFRSIFFHGMCFHSSIGVLPRGHDILTLTRSSIFHVLVSPSAYPADFPQALASETIPQLIRIRLTPTPFAERANESLFRSCASFAVECRTPLSAGLLWSASWITSSLSSRAGLPAGFTMPVLGQANLARVGLRQLTTSV